MKTNDPILSAVLTVAAGRLTGETAEAAFIRFRKEATDALDKYSAEKKAAALAYAADAALPGTVVNGLLEQAIRLQEITHKLNEAGSRAVQKLADAGLVDDALEVSRALTHAWDKD